MNIASINSINALNESSALNLGGEVKTPKSNFADWLQKEISNANTQINQANTDLKSYAIGNTNNLHDVMMSIEDAKESFELVVQVRNRLLDGYQEIMRMQI